jgi:hypothetical protein
MSFGGAKPNLNDPEYLKSLPSVGDETLLTDSPQLTKAQFGQEARVGQKIYKWGGGNAGWEYSRTIPDDAFNNFVDGSSSGEQSAGGSGGGGGGGGSRSAPLLDAGMNLGPYPFANDYAPMLAVEYQAPAAQDFSAFMAPNSPFAGGAPAVYGQSRFPGDPSPAPATPVAQDIGGLLYQPGSTEYQQAFVPDDLWTYRPIQMGVGSPGFIKPSRPVEFIEVEEEGSEA